MRGIRKVPQKDGSVHWQVQVRLEGHRPRVKTFNTLSDARRWKRAQEIEIQGDDSGITSEAHRHTLAELIAQYRAQVLPELRPTTQRPYQTHLAWWEAKLGALHLNEIHPHRIAACRDELTRSGKAPATVLRYLATLASVLTAGVQRWNWLTDSPMRQIHKPTVRNNRARFLDEQELDSLLDACHRSESPDLLLAVLLAISTGARQGEIMNLRWRDIDWPRHLLQLRAGVDTTTKGGARSASLAAEVLPLLKARHEAFQAREALAKVPSRDPGAELVFPSRVSRSAPVNLRRPFMTALARAGITGFVWHDLRHSAASFLAKDGASLVEIGAVLGHRSANTTKRYSHLVEGHIHGLTRAMASRLLAVEPAALHSVDTEGIPMTSSEITPVTVSRPEE